MSRSAGRPIRPTWAEVDRWRAKILPTAACWVFVGGSVGSDGYGRVWVRRPGGGGRMVTPHQLAAELAFGPVPAGATVLHECDVRLCCRTGPGHVRIGTQAENMRQAAERGRWRGPKPGLADTRGEAGASRAIQAALRAAAGAGATQAELARVLAATIAEGDPRAPLYPLFDLAPDGRGVTIR